jgi:hypothetical protein
VGLCVGHHLRNVRPVQQHDAGDIAWLELAEQFPIAVVHDLSATIGVVQTDGVRV